MRHRVFATCITVVALIYCLTAAAAARGETIKKKSSVLVINSYHQGYEWSDNEMTGILTTLRARFPDLDIRVEYLDTKNNAQQDYFLKLSQLFAFKYLHVPLSLILTLDDPALVFALEFRKDLFKAVPIIFCGINNYNPSMLAGHEDITGIVQTFDIRNTVNLMRRLHPAAEELFVVVDATVTGNAARAHAETVFSEMNLPLRITFSENPAVKELVQRVRQLPDTALVFVLSFATDREGSVFDFDNFTELLCQNSRVPVYGAHAERLGHGIVGGYLLEGAHHGQQAAQIAVRILAGEAPESIPFGLQASAKPMFDYTLLARFGIATALLPEESIIINEPLPLYKKYKIVIGTSLGIICLLISVILVLHFNIRKRKSAEKKLQQSEQKFRSVIEQASDGIFILDMQGRFIDGNQRVCDFMGCGKQQLLALSVWDIAPAFLPDRFKAFTQSLRPHAPVTIEYEIKTGTGSVVPAEIRIGLIDINGVRHIMGMARDISERKQAEKALRDSEELYRSVVETATDAIITVNRHGIVVSWNNAAQLMFGYSRDEIAGSSIAALWPERLRAAHMQWLEKNMSFDGQMPMQQRTQEALGLRKNGEEFFADVTGAPWKSGGEVFYTVIYRDITERKKEQEQLRQAQKMEAIGTLAGGIAHDFNNILSSIYGYTEIALDDARDNRRISNSLAHVMKAAERAKELVLQILTFSRKKEEEKKPLRIAPVLNEAIKLLRAAIPATIEIRANIDKNTGTILGDPTQIHQVIMNLCTNANHAMQEKGGVLAIELKPVSLTTGDVSAVPGLRLGPFIKLTVSDTGSGIDPAIIDRIFDPFFTTKELGRGTGMGLSVVHGIVKSHDGAITVASEPGRGSTFTVLLPRIDEKQQEQPVREEKPLPGGSESVLLVDDEAAIVESGRQMLESLGYKVTDLQSSIKALEVFQQTPELFDIVITDHTMPDLTGYDLAEKILQIRKDIPVILCTGYSEMVSEEKARSLGIRAFFMKPVRAKALAVMIRKVLDNKAA